VKKSKAPLNTVVGSCPICGDPIMSNRAYGMFCGNSEHRIIFDELCLEADNEPEQIEKLLKERYGR
jgi:hypothetical protein